MYKLEIFSPSVPLVEVAFCQRRRAMSIKSIEIPLFPLNVVLFPGMVLPLHIFEPRYRQMIADCQRQGLEFGVVLVQPESIFLREEPFAVGTMAAIRDLDRLEDGRLNVI